MVSNSNLDDRSAKPGFKDYIDLSKEKKLPDSTHLNFLQSQPNFSLPIFPTSQLDFLVTKQENKNSTSRDSYSLGKKFKDLESNTQDLEENYKENDLEEFLRIGQIYMNLNVEQH